MEPAAAQAVSAATSLSGATLRVVLHPLLGAPAFASTRHTLAASERVADVAQWLSTALHLKTDNLHIYVLGACGEAFAPGGDELIGALSQCFSTDGVLVLKYALRPVYS